MGPRSASRGRAAAAVEEPQLDSARVGVSQQPLLRRVKLPLAGEEPAVLRGVRVAEHDLLAVRARRQLRGVHRLLVQRGHRRLRPVEILDGLEQRHKRQRRQLPDADPGPAHQHERGQNVGRALDHRDDHAPDRLQAVRAQASGNMLLCYFPGSNTARCL